MLEPEKVGKIEFVTRGQAAVVVAILVALIIYTNIRLSIDEKEIKAHSQEYGQILDGLKEIHHDITLFTNELVDAKKQERP